MSVNTQSSVITCSWLFDLLHNCFEGLGMIHCEISEYLTIKVDTGRLELSHKFGIRHSVEACAGIDPGDPERTEISLFRLAVAVGIAETFLDCILGDGPNVLLSTEETFGQFEHAFALGP
jgi:hypothetical protein